MKYVVAGLLAGLAIGVWGTTTVRNARHSAEIAELQREQTEQTLRNSAAALESYSRMEKQKDEAIKAAEVLASKNRAEADAASRALVGLRGELSRVPARIESASRAAVNEYATTAGQLLESCADEYRSLAVITDGHAADVRMILAAWPRTISPSDTDDRASPRQLQ